MNKASLWHYRWHAARLIQRRDLYAMLRGRGVYILLSLALLAAVLVLRNYLNFVDENGLLVNAGAFNFPLLAVVFLSAIFLALSSVASIARERDQGTMEALFYGPIDAIAYIGGTYLAQIITYLIMVLVYVVCFVIYAAFTNFALPVGLAWITLLSILVTSDVIAFGIFLSALSGRVRTAMLLFLSIMLVLIAIQFGQDILASVSLEERYYNPVLFLQNVLMGLNNVIGWLSPFSYLMRGMEAIRRGSSSLYILTSMTAVIFTVVFLALSVVTLERKGVRK